jgi:hypothetical protein
MTDQVHHDMGWSSALFISQVWPIIKRDVGGGDLLLMEGRPDVELAKLLDMRAGIDGWHLMQGGGIRGIASRIQKGDKVWETFTVRRSRSSGADTEFQKRKDAIQAKDGQIYPHLTVQAYAKTEQGPVLAAGICKTADLIAFIESGMAEVRTASNATFFVCSWSRMMDAGYKVKRSVPPNS